jgi:2-dehydro-3-deoxygalactonokinase
MNTFLSCDWGTTSFRLRLIETAKLQILAEEIADTGIANTYRLWQEQGGQEATREAFYMAIIDNHIKTLSIKLGTSLNGVPVILSGMASSNIGLINLPYKLLPYNAAIGDVNVKLFQGNYNPYLIVSGACSSDDIMRGEETKVIGCVERISNNQHSLLLLPGTHPKHIWLNGGVVTGFKSYMTGEFFEFLSSKSILAASVQDGGNFDEKENYEGFSQGVSIGLKENILHGSFLTRTREILKNSSKQSNYYFLSGLLIGAELKDINIRAAVYLVGGATHIPLYDKALYIAGNTLAGAIDADAALIKGQYLLLCIHLKLQVL